jgi:carbon starvation protein CstA
MTTMDTTTARPGTTPRHASDRYIVFLTVGALIVESAVGIVALLRDFGPHLLSTAERTTPAGDSAWVSLWELLQILVAISLVLWAVLLARATRRGLFGALVVQGAAVGLSGYHVLHTLPDSVGLIALVMVTTILLSTRAVREWCLGRSDEAFELLIADHRPSPHR